MKEREISDGQWDEIEGIFQFRETFFSLLVFQDQSGDNATEIKHRISQTRKAINALNSIWCHKNITKNRKLHIYQTIIQNILMYGAEVWQIPTG